MTKKNVFKRVLDFYVEGFRNQSKDSRRLWLIILIKLFIMFAILRVFFFKDFLSSKNLNSDKEKSEFIINNLTQKEYGSD